MPDSQPHPPSQPPFLALARATPHRQPVESRVRHWREFYEQLPESELRSQGARCMDCGVPFCQSDSGCPVRNVIPEFNALVRRGKWREAHESLHATNNFPEFTGRLCPAPCESACVLGVIAEPVAIRSIEQSIADRAYEKGWITARPPERETGRRVAIVGSGPAGLAAAQQLRRLGHRVEVFEKSDRVGGLLRYGIPAFKLEKHVLDRRIAQLQEEGVQFHVGCEAGVAISVERLRAEYDAIVLALGADAARELSVPGRELRGVVQAMPYLTQQNKRDAGDAISDATAIDARGRHVVIIGGGDTGSDCAGTAIRQGAASVQQFELLSRPPELRADSTPWPLWPMQLRTSHAHEEGAERSWSISTTALRGEDGQVLGLNTVRVTLDRDEDGAVRIKPVEGSEREIEAHLVILAMGFTGPRRAGIIGQLGVGLSQTGAIRTDGLHRTNVPGVFAAGDARRGASLIVWAIREGRDVAESVDAYLADVGAETGAVAAS